MEGGPSPICECHHMQHKFSRSSKMLIISAVVQWMLMLLCIVSLAVLFLRKEEILQVEDKPVVFTKFQKRDANSKKLPLIHVSGSMQVENGSVIIPKDGTYLLFLDGCLINLSQKSNVTIWWKENVHHKIPIFTESTKNGCIRNMFIKELTQSGEISAESELIKQFNNFSLSIILMI